LPPLLFAHTHAVGNPSITKTNLKLRGGTNAIQAPQIDYTTQVFLPFLKSHWNIELDFKIRKRGYWPKGGGEVQVSIPSFIGPLQSVTLTERGKVTKIHGYSYAAGLPEHVAKSMSAAAQIYLSEHSSAQGYSESSITIRSQRESPAVAVASGSGIILWAETENGCVIGGSAMGMKGKDPGDVGREAAEQLVRNLAHGGCVDEYLQVGCFLFFKLVSEFLQDQIIIFLALAEGTSSVLTGPLTLHTRWVPPLQ